jgi:hypothetical protein
MAQAAARPGLKSCPRPLSARYRGWRVTGEARSAIRKPVDCGTATVTERRVLVRWLFYFPFGPGGSTVSGRHRNRFPALPLLTSALPKSATIAHPARVS